MEESVDLSVREIMLTDPVCVPPSTSVAEAAVRMNERNLGAALVCRDHLLVGIFTERDLLRRAAARRHWIMTTVAEFMTPNPITIAPDLQWPSALAMMVARRIRHLPVVEEGRLVGMLTSRDLLERRARHLEAVVLERTAELERKNAALSERDRLMQMHLAMAGRIQRQLLPLALPRSERLEWAAAYQPLHRVSGDYYDFSEPAPGQVGVLIADACGHGIPAAFVSVMAKAAYQAYARGLSSPALVLATLNRQFLNLIEAEHFITMFYAVADEATLELRFASAGHPPPLWHRRRTGDVQTLNAPGTVIGLLPEPAFGERAVQLEPGDTVLFYTDGVVECRNESGAMFGEAPLAEFLQSHAQTPARQLVEMLEARLALFRGSWPRSDDITCIALRVR